MTTNRISLVIIMFWWFSGISISQGFLQTTASLIFPPYAMYVTVDRVMAEFELNNKVCENYTEVPMPTMLVPEE